MGANANWTNAGGPGVASNVKRAEKTLRRSLALDGDSAKTLRLLGVCVYQLCLVLQARLLPPAHCRPPPHSLRAGTVVDYACSAARSAHVRLGDT